MKGTSASHLQRGNLSGSKHRGVPERLELVTAKRKEIQFARLHEADRSKGLETLSHGSACCLAPLVLVSHGLLTEVDASSAQRRPFGRKIVRAPKWTCGARVQPNPRIPELR